MENNGNSLKANSTGRLAVTLMAISGAAPAMCVGGSFGSLMGVSGVMVAFAFVVATIGITFAAAQYGSMATRFNGCGGTYSFVRAGLGDRAGFWSALIYCVPIWCAAIPCALSAMSLNELVPAVPAWIWGLVVAGILFLVCVRGIELTSTALIIVWIIQMVLLVWPAIKILSMGEAGFANAVAAFNPAADINSDYGFNGVIAGALLAIWAYVGFEAPAYMGEEIKGGAKSVRFCLIAGAIACGVIYVIVSWLWTGAMTPEQAEAVAGQDNALVVYCNLVGYVVGGKIVNLAIVASALACGLTFISMGGRFYYDLGRKAYLPKVFTKVNKFQAPWVGLLTYTIHWYLIALFVGMLWDINHLFNMQANSAVFSYILVTIANMKVRWHDKNVFGSKIVPLIALAILIYMLLSAGLAGGMGTTYFIISICVWVVFFIVACLWYPGYKKKVEAGLVEDTSY